MDFDPFEDEAPERTFGGQLGEVVPGIAAGAVGAFGTAMRGLAAVTDPGAKYRSTLEAIGSAATPEEYGQVEEAASGMRYGGAALRRVLQAAREGDREPWQKAVDSLPGSGREQAAVACR